MLPGESRKRPGNSGRGALLPEASLEDAGDVLIGHLAGVGGIEAAHGVAGAFRKSHALVLREAVVAHPEIRDAARVLQGLKELLINKL